MQVVVSPEVPELKRDSSDVIEGKHDSMTETKPAATQVVGEVKEGQGKKKKKSPKKNKGDASKAESDKKRCGECKR